MPVKISIMASRLHPGFLLAILLAAACGTATAPTAPGETATSANLRREIVVLGDSLAISPSRAQGFPARLQARLDASYSGWSVINAGVGGDTTADGVRRMDEVMTPKTAILVLELGANDGLRGISIATIEKNLSAIIERAQARELRVLLCGMETPPLNGWNYSVEFHRLFPRVAARYNVPLVPFLLAGVALNPEFNGADEIHPNAAGADRIAATVWPFLEPLVKQTQAR
jgi:acyl-CoA thioesterase-1